MTAPPPNASSTISGVSMSIRVAMSSGRIAGVRATSR